MKANHRSLNYAPGETEERVRIMLDATPLCCNLWDENYNNIACNQEAVNLFELKDKQEYLDRFYELSPEYQPDGRLSKDKALEMIKIAFEKGRNVFEWMHKKLNGEPVPSEIILVRVRHGDKYIVAGYTRDLRALKASIEEIREADERVRIMLDATPLCSNFWDEHYNNIDCNQEAVNLFELSSKEEYLERFHELSPEYQPDGRLSKEKAFEKIQQAFETGRANFEWMHQKLNGEPIPSEITLVRVKYKNKNIVLGYTRDLRELKKTVLLLNQLERLAFTDSLTGIYNRRHFIDNAQKAFNTYPESNQPLSIIMMDIDFFKRINDTYGHAAGDEVLKSVANAAQSVLRTDDLLARYGGEEFVIMVFNSAEDLAFKLAERIRQKIRESSFLYQGEEISVTVSLGLATKSAPQQTLEETIDLADKALYRAKRNGRDRVEKSAAGDKGEE